MTRLPADAASPLTFSDEADEGLRGDGVLAEPERVVAEERRRSPRVSVQWPMVVDFGTGPLDALLADLAVSGVGAHLPQGCPEPSVGAEFAADVPLRDGTVRAVARVVWADTRPGRGPSFGAEFVAMSPEAAEALRHHVDQARVPSPHQGVERPAWVAKLHGQTAPPKN